MKRIHELAPLSPEKELLLQCLCVRPDREDEERIRTLARGNPNWARFQSDALGHWVVAPVCRRLLTVAGEVIPAKVAESLEELRKRAVFRSLMLSGWLVRILLEFTAAGIEAIPYKGPALSAIVYGDVAERNYDDLDFLVRQKDIEAAKRILKASGFRLTDRLRRLEERMGSGKIPGQYLFNHEMASVVLEVHTERTLRYYPRPLDLNAMLQRLQPVQISQNEFRTFSLEDTLILICVHGTKHFWKRLLWVSDIAHFAELEARVRWELVLERARQLGCERQVLLGLELARILLGARPAAVIEQRLAAEPVCSKLAHRIGKELCGGEKHKIGILERMRFRVGMAESFSVGVRHGLRLALSPTEEDWDAIPLPGWLSRLYWVVRPLRLMKKYGAGLLQKTDTELAIYLPTPVEVVNLALRMAEIRPGDVLYDLGCGDGRVVVTAAKEFGIRGVGVDKDPQRIREANANARRNGVSHLVRFLKEDIRTTDLSRATIIYMYLGLPANLLLQSRIAERMRAGARVVTADFDFPDWEAERFESAWTTQGEMSFYLWRLQKAAKTPTEEAVVVPAVGIRGEQERTGN